MAGMTTRWGALRMFGLAARAALRPGGPSIATRVAAMTAIRWPRTVARKGRYASASSAPTPMTGARRSAAAARVWRSPSCP